MFNVIHYILQALVCLVEIAGIVAGAIAVSHRRARIGGLAMAGFLLLILNLLINILLELTRTYVVSHFINILWVSPCVAAPLALAGVICLVLAIFSALSEPKEKPAIAPKE